MLLSISS